jgi:hypothetical protein
MPERPSARLLKLPRWQRVLVLVAFLVLINLWPVHDAWQAATSEPTTIHVTECPQVITRTNSCKGTWTLPDGSAGHGPVDGYISTVPGASLPGRATHAAATAKLSVWLIAPIVGAVVTLGALGLAGAFYLRYRRVPPQTG